MPSKSNNPWANGGEHYQDWSKENNPALQSPFANADKEYGGEFENAETEYQNEFANAGSEYATIGDEYAAIGNEVINEFVPAEANVLDSRELFENDKYVLGLEGKEAKVQAGVIPPRNAAALGLLAKLKQWQTAPMPKFGHQDSLAYGRNWYYQNGKLFNDFNNKAIEGKYTSDIYQVSGLMPTVFGWDVGEIESNTYHMINGVNKTDFVELVKWVHLNGGVNTICWHCVNPLNGEKFTEIFQNGKAANSNFITLLKNVKNLLLKIPANIPLIFRPFHESNFSANFWWHKSKCTKTEFKQLWALMHSYIGTLPNVIFDYNLHDPWNGSETIDNNLALKLESDFYDHVPNDASSFHIVSLDIYAKESDKKDYTKLQNRVALLTNKMLQYASNKPVAISEIGDEFLNEHNDWWTNCYTPALINKKVAFAMLWRNTKISESKQAYFVPYPNHNSAVDFLKLNTSSFIKIK